MKVKCIGVLNQPPFVDAFLLCIPGVRRSCVWGELRRTAASGVPWLDGGGVGAPGKGYAQKHRQPNGPGVEMKGADKGPMIQTRPKEEQIKFSVTASALLRDAMDGTQTTSSAILLLMKFHWAKPGEMGRGPFF